jgi:hypothetical protein
MKISIRIIMLCLTLHSTFSFAGLDWFSSKETGQIEIKRVPSPQIIERIIAIKTEKGMSLEKQDKTEVSFTTENTKPCQSTSNNNCYTRLIYNVIPSGKTTTTLRTRIELITDLDPAMSKSLDITDALAKDIDEDLSTLKTRIEQNL